MKKELKLIVKSLVVGFSIAVLVHLYGCMNSPLAVGYPATNGMLEQCRKLQDEVARARCLSDAYAATPEENQAKLEQLFRISPEHCVAITMARDDAIFMRFGRQLADIQVREYMSRTLPRVGPGAFTDAEIFGLVAWSFQGPCLKCGYRDLLDENARVRRVCLGLPADLPARPNGPPAWSSNMEKWYGSAQVREP